VPTPVVVPTPVAAPVVPSAPVVPTPVPPSRTAPPPPLPPPAPRPPLDLQVGTSMRWWVLILLAVLGWSLTWLVIRVRGTERGLVMALVSVVVLVAVFLRERRRVAVG
jgi:hypothetical protein